MHRTQIYFDEELFERIRSKARRLNVSISAYIRETVRKDLEDISQTGEINLEPFIGMWNQRKGKDDSS